MSTEAEYEPPTQGHMPRIILPAYAVKHMKRHLENIGNVWHQETIRRVREQSIDFGPYERPAKAYMRREIRARTPQYIAPRTN